MKDLVLWGGFILKLGNKIRELRISKDMTIKELAERAELSTGMISQIERDKIGLSVTSLWNISKALNISVGYFFNEMKRDNHLIVRKGQHKEIKLADSNAIYELLTPDLLGKIEFLKIILEAGEGNNSKQTSHEGEECGIVIQGKLLFKYGDKEYILNEGDSIRINSAIPHKYTNIGDTKSISIWAMTPPSF